MTRDEIVASFRQPHYLEINKARLEHLESLDLGFSDSSVLEVGAGIGDLSEAYIHDAGLYEITDGRRSNVEIIIDTHGGGDILNMDNPSDEYGVYDYIICYGLLYHLEYPIKALRWMSKRCKTLVLETCTSDTANSYQRAESIEDPSQSVNGVGTYLTKEKLMGVLEALFDGVTIPHQPIHKDYPDKRIVILAWNSNE